MAPYAGAILYPGVALDRGVVTTMLNAVAAASSGTSTEYGLTPSTPTKEAIGTFAFSAIVAGGTFSAVSVKIQGSLDGTNWFDLVTLSSATGGYQAVSAQKIRYLRANVVTLTSSGGTPTYTLQVLY